MNIEQVRQRKSQLKFMKVIRRLTGILFLFLTINSHGQLSSQALDWEKEILRDKNFSRKNYKNSITRYDFGSLWTDTENSSVYGFIGNNYRRLRTKIISTAKAKNAPDTYAVSGKSMIRNNVCEFSGTIKITRARIYKKMRWGVEDEYKNAGIKKQGIIFAEYRLSENKACIFSGVFTGLLLTRWYIDKNGKLNYDDIEKQSDSYGNNQFVGVWKSYRGDIVKNSNWGDYRIPLSGDLDGGAGEFSPIDKYLQFGWQTHRDAYVDNSQQARQTEERQWWK